MKKLFHLLFLLPPFIFSQTIGDIEFGTPETFDVITWNIEFFPKNGQTTLQYVATIVDALDADIIAIQEVDDYFVWNDLVAILDDYSGYRTSINNRGLAYLYKTDLVQINSGFEIFTQDPEANNFPRYPMVLDVVFAGERYVIINNHFKCCGNGVLEIGDPGDEETRRFNASNLLKEYIDTNLEDVNVILLGDLNDLLTDSEANNVFIEFLNDTDNYQFVDLGIAQGSSDDWSFPNWPSHLDHILITNELFDDFSNEGSSIETIRIDDFLTGGFDEYDDNVSDHRPVGMKLAVAGILNSNDLAFRPTVLNVPNPVTTTTRFLLSEAVIETTLSIFNIQGQQLMEQAFVDGQKELKVDLSTFAAGVYIAHLKSAGNVLETVRIIKR